MVRRSTAISDLTVNNSCLSALQLNFLFARTKRTTSLSSESTLTLPTKTPAYRQFAVWPSAVPNSRI